MVVENKEMSSNDPKAVPNLNVTLPLGSTTTTASANPNPTSVSTPFVFSTPLGSATGDPSTNSVVTATATATPDNPNPPTATATTPSNSTPITATSIPTPDPNPNPPTANTSPNSTPTTATATATSNNGTATATATVTFTVANSNVTAVNVNLADQCPTCGALKRGSPPLLQEIRNLESRSKKRTLDSSGRTSVNSDQTTKHPFLTFYEAYPSSTSDSTKVVKFPRLDPSRPISSFRFPLPVVNEERVIPPISTGDDDKNMMSQTFDGGNDTIPATTDSKTEDKSATENRDEGLDD